MENENLKLFTRDKLGLGDRAPPWQIHKCLHISMVQYVLYGFTRCDKGTGWRAYSFGLLLLKKSDPPSFLTFANLYKACRVFHHKFSSNLQQISPEEKKRMTADAICFSAAPLLQRSPLPIFILHPSGRLLYYASKVYYVSTTTSSRTVLCGALQCR